MGVGAQPNCTPRPPGGGLGVWTEWAPLIGPQNLLQEVIPPALRPLAVGGCRPPQVLTKTVAGVSLFFYYGFSSPSSRPFFPLPFPVLSFHHVAVESRMILAQPTPLFNAGGRSMQVE